VMFLAEEGRKAIVRRLERSRVARRSQLEAHPV
jgi:hypothetical protein